MDRVHIQGTPIDVITAENAAHLVLERMDRGVGTRVAAVNAAIIVMAAHNDTLREALQDFDLVIADGKWAALAATCLTGRWVPHTNTSPFLRVLFRDSGKRGLRVFLWGARPEVVREAAAQLSKLFPKITVIGYEHGYFQPDEEEAIVSRISNSKADLLLIGMTTPKKEMLITEHWTKLSVGMAFGIGGLIDIWGGKTREAPDWLRNSGLEWLFRLVQEPRRLWRRYTGDNLSFFWIVLKQAFGRR